METVTIIILFKKKILHVVDMFLAGYKKKKLKKKVYKQKKKLFQTNNQFEEELNMCDNGIISGGLFVQSRELILVVKQSFLEDVFKNVFKF
jgi:hypothetical protein